MLKGKTCLTLLVPTPLHPNEKAAIAANSCGDRWSQRRSRGERGERTATAKSVPEYVRQEFSQGACIHPQDGLHINRV